MLSSRNAARRSTTGRTRANAHAGWQRRLVDIEPRLRKVVGYLCSAQIDPALIARSRPAIFGCFWPIFFFAEHNGLSARTVNGAARA